MKTAMQDPAPRSKFQSVASVAGAIVLAVFAATFFTYANILWNPGYYGEYGLGVDTFTNSVGEIVPGSPADRAGIKLGDKVQPPQALRDRLVLAGIAPHPGERITLSTFRGSQHRTVTLQAWPVAPLPLFARVMLGLKFLWLFVFLGVGFILVLLRPSLMTWGFYLFALNLAILFWPADQFFSYVPSGWSIALRIAQDIIAPAGAAGFLIFCVRFPAYAPTGWRKAIQGLALCVFAVLASNLIYSDLEAIHLTPLAPVVILIVGVMLVGIFISGIVILLNTLLVALGLEHHWIKWVVLGMLGIFAAFVIHRVLADWNDDWAVFPVFILGAIAVLVTYFGARGLERQRIKWVILGLICAFVAHTFDLIGPENGSLLYHPGGVTGVAELLYAVLPIAVAYAVFRHRVIDIRFFVSRSLAVGVIVSLFALVVIGIDWLFSTRLPNSRLEAAVYAGVALLVGFSLNAARQRIGKTLDFLFFRQWHKTQEQAEAIGDTLRRATSMADLYEPLTAGIARAFSLASAALFERVEDGGFVRIAAYAWPVGTLWHILLDDPLIRLANERRRATDIETFRWQGRGPPAGVARPMVMLPIVVSRQVSAMLVCGAHDNGTGLDPDEIRTIRRLCADASLVYSKSPVEELGRTAVFDRQREPLGA